MLSQGAVMLARSGSATSPGLATTPQRQAPVRLLSTGAQGSPTKASSSSPLSPPIKHSSIPILKQHNAHPKPAGPVHSSPSKSIEGPSPIRIQPLSDGPPNGKSVKRRSSLPSLIDIAAPPKPPRGCLDTPTEPTDAPPKSAFRPLAVPGWKETSLDDVPNKRRPTEKVRRHTVTLPQSQRRNGPAPAEHVINGSPQRRQAMPQPQPHHVAQKAPASRPIVTIEPRQTLAKREAPSQATTESETKKDGQTSLHRQNSDPGSRPEIPVVDKKGALKIQHLKEQYAKLRKLQEEQKMMEEQSKNKATNQPGVTQPASADPEGPSTDSQAKTLTPTTVEVDVSYSQGETSKAEDQDEVT
jgi:hypothetical protein